MSERPDPRAASSDVQLATKPRRPPGRVKRTAAGGWARGNAAYDRSKDSVEGQDPASRKGATVGPARRYRAAERCDLLRGGDLVAA
jgi:hypothetical protein